MQPEAHPRESTFRQLADSAAISGGYGFSFNCRIRMLDRGQSFERKPGEEVHQGAF
jgi:hypothetical protein